MNDGIFQQNPDGTWTPAIPLKLAWWVRLSQWRQRRKARAADPWTREYRR
jgi:hypothetical protein